MSKRGKVPGEKSYGYGTSLSVIFLGILAIEWSQLQDEMGEDIETR